jgi:hypothetical protein
MQEWRLPAGSVGERPATTDQLNQDEKTLIFFFITA